MRIDKLVHKRKRFRKLPFLMIFPDGAYANGKKVDLDKFNQKYADEIKEAEKLGRFWCIDITNAQGEEPKEL